jgi:hypothetical protein
MNFDFTVKVLNHSDFSETFILKPNVPDGFIVEPGTASIVLDPLAEGEKKFKCRIGKNVPPGVSLITLDVGFDDWDLREWTEAIIEISPQ